MSREHVIGDPSDFPPGTLRVVNVGRREIGVFNIGGKLYGLPNVCPHQTGPLCEGKFALDVCCQVHAHNSLILP